MMMMMTMQKTREGISLRWTCTFFLGGFVWICACTCAFTPGSSIWVLVFVRVGEADRGGREGKEEDRGVDEGMI